MAASYHNSLQRTQLKMGHKRSTVPNTGVSGETAVVGAGGFLGTNLCRRLVQEGARVRGIGHAPRFPHAVPDLQWTKCDQGDREEMTQVLEGCESVVHLADDITPATAAAEPAAAAQASLVPYLYCLDACVNAGVKRVILVSSGGTVYGDQKTVPIPEDAQTSPISSYGLLKLTRERYLQLYAQAHGLQALILRISNPFGPYQGVRGQQGAIAAFIGCALRHDPIDLVGDGTVTRDYLYIDDLVDAMLKAVSYEGDCEVFNIGSGVGRSLREVLRDVEAVHGSSLALRHLPERPFDVPVSVLDISRAKLELGWTPTCDWMTALSRTYEWFQGQLSLPRQA